MNTKLFVLPSLLLGGAAMLVLPAKESEAFSKIGGSLGTTQRDFRVFNNFVDATSNDNTTSPAQFPGWDGAELAIWKGAIEWSSLIHGDGTGDPQSGNVLGGAGANFDPFWAGSATAVGNADQNIVSTVNSCSSGVIAYMEGPISNGWRIRFCDSSFAFEDGPGTVGGRIDIQGIMTHEYGHALGLGHSAVNGATMFASYSGGTGARSIAADDISGILCVYGATSGTKPTIVATVPSGGSMTIYGTNFSATDNEVWFTNNTATTPATDPLVKVTGVLSPSGTEVTVTIPGGAGPGDVIVKKSGTGNATLSNAFPTDLVNTFGTPPTAHPNITSVTPSTIDALIPGTAQTITITGTDLDLTTDVLVDGSPVAASRYTVVNATTITLDMPQVNTLGAHTIGATDGVGTDSFNVTIVTPALPKYELGNGDTLNVVDRTFGLTYIVSGTVGSSHRVQASLSNVPSVNAFVSLDIGNNFTELIDGGSIVIPAAGWASFTIPASGLPIPPLAGTTFYSQNYDQTFPTPFDVSNLQSIVLVP
ncbi:MAG: matrixin family metalloprotease [Planctomycetota bacterium]